MVIAYPISIVQPLTIKTKNIICFFGTVQEKILNNSSRELDLLLVGF